MKNFTTNELLKYVDELNDNIFNARDDLRNNYHLRISKKALVRYCKQLITAVNAMKKRLQKMSLDSLQVLLKHTKSNEVYFAVKNELERRCTKDDAHVLR